MSKWERFGDDTWINVDHVEVVRVEEQEHGGWVLSAAFASGRTYPLGSHDDRDLLAECTDVILRGEASDVLRAVADSDSETSVGVVSDPEPSMELAAPLRQAAVPTKRNWRFWRTSREQPSGMPDGQPDATPVPVS